MRQRLTWRKILASISSEMVIKLTKDAIEREGEEWDRYGLRIDKERTISYAIRNIKGYPGKYIYIVGGLPAGYGEDSVEGIIKNAEVIAILK